MIQTNTVLQKVENLILKTRQSVLNNNLLPFIRLETAFDFQTFRFIKTKQTNILFNTDNLFLLTRLLELLMVVRQNLRNKQSITKRNIFYKLQRYYKNYSVIDDDIEILCHTLNLHRCSLKIIASSRSMIRGKITIRYGKQIIQSNSKVVLNLPTAHQIIPIEIGFNTILVVEKESVFHQLQQILSREGEGGILEDILIMTGRGYPDFCARSLLQILKDKVDNIYYLGDSDIFGFDILTCYAFGDHDYTGLFDKIKWMNAEMLGDFGLMNKKILKKEYIDLTKEDFRKAQLILERDYMKQQNIDKMTQNGSINKQCGQKLRRWRERLMKIVMSKKKIQVQSLIKASTLDNWAKKIIQLQLYS